MATSNFGSTIFNKYFTVDADDVELYEEQKDEIKNVIRSLPEASDDVDDLEYLATVRANVEHVGVPFELSIKVYLRPGYYSGGYLDGRLFIDGVEYYNISDIIDDSADLLEQGFWDTDQACQYRSPGAVTGFARMQTKNLARKIEKAFNGMLANIEAAVAPVTEQYAAVAHFDNGETLYQKIA